MDPYEPEKITRRSFLNRSTAAIGAATVASTAISYGRILGANDRISLGQIGIGNRGSELQRIIAPLKDKHNVEMTAVCDLWKVNRERATARAEKVYGRAPRSFQHPEELLALKDVDAVADRCARARALAVAEAHCRGRQGRLCGKAHGECSWGRLRPRATR